MGFTSTNPTSSILNFHKSTKLSNLTDSPPTLILFRVKLKSPLIRTPYSFRQSQENKSYQNVFLSFIILKQAYHLLTLSQGLL